MIKYQLICTSGHEFEGWFQSSTAYDDQAANGQVVCPVCGSLEVSKAVMAPNIAARRSAQQQAAHAQAVASMRKLRAEVESRSEYVGSRFAEEARKIHLDEKQPRGIYGEATVADAKDLIDEGIPVMPLPRLPEDEN